MFVKNPTAMSADSGETLVFVYGTLLRGEESHGLLHGARFAGEAVTLPDWDLADLQHYPALVPAGRTKVRGELYGVDERLLEELDRFEGHPLFYCRLPIVLADGRCAQTYTLDPERAAPYPRIASGDWRRR